MNDKKLQLILMIMSFCATIFTSASFFTSWWCVQTSIDKQIGSNSSIKAEYGLFQTVTVTLVYNNNATVITLPLENLTIGGEGNVNPIASELNIALLLTAAGLGLSIIMTALIVLTLLLGVWFKRGMIIGYIGTILLLISPLYVAISFPSVISQATTVIPLDTIKSEIILKPSDIKFFWGSIQGSKPTVFTNLTWGAGVGWFLTFSASILLGIVSLIFRELVRIKKLVLVAKS